MSAVEFYNDTCSLCGKSTANAMSTVEQVIEGTPYVFDTDSCLAVFKKIQDVYGKSFVTELAFNS